jgi:quercetin dioxygenase-like cupin family protein
MTNVVRSFADALALALPTAPTPTNPANDNVRHRLEDFHSALTAVDHTETRTADPGSLPEEAQTWLQNAIDGAQGAPGVVRAVRDAATAGSWYQIYESGSASGRSASEPREALTGGMFAAQMIGSRGLVNSDTLLAGLFLLGPGLHYPLHQHPATEIYFGVSGEIGIQHGLEGEPQALGPAEVSLTPSNRLHALTVGASPVLLLYCWLGELGGRQWWWRQDSDGHWHRDAYERTARASWERTASQAVPADVLARH